MITYTNLEEIVAKGALNQKGGLKYSDLILRGLISYYVPFLPLERKHVKMCATAEASKRGLQLSQELLDKVANSMAYWPEDTLKFSSFGCRGVDKKVELVLERNRKEL